MPLLERVSRLLRANLNELIEKAEDPEKTMKQLVLDMENQLLQVKTQVAIALADQHLLDKKCAEQQKESERWRGRAELAVSKGEDDMARAALARSLSHEHSAEGFAQQAEDQKSEAESLRQMLLQLQQKLAETRSRCDMLIAEHRRARIVGVASHVRSRLEADEETTLSRMKHRVQLRQSQTEAVKELTAGDSLEERFSRLENEDKVEILLQELKQNAPKTA